MMPTFSVDKSFELPSIGPWSCTMKILAKNLIPSLGSLEAFRPFFPGDIPPWDWLPAIAIALQSLKMDGGEMNSFVHPEANISPSATVGGPVYIGARTEVRAGVCIRGFAIIGENCVIGSGCEIKNALIGDRAQVPHLNYVGDSILGQESHLGAGAILANLRFDKKNIAVAAGGKRIETGRKKFGAAIGDGAQIGCNAVLRPGTVIGKNSIVYDGVSFGGYLPDGHIARLRQELEIVKVKET
ncbi:MAG: UDP-N-acetylglucosamine diphosphorylase [Puniceicoccales bacterium]|jgi:NDP-sugar pyrophosphorylase family protein|nr:UDP-N-acetylglucosamine diphosphorylase [Puniceicoccales bacterium]